MKRTKNLQVFIKEFIKRCSEMTLSLLAAQTSFFIVLAFFPFFIFLLTLIKQAHLDDSLLIESMEKILPTNIFQVTTEIFLSAQDKSSIFLTLGGVAATLWVTSRAIHSLYVGINKLYYTTETRNAIRRMGISFLSTILLISMIIASLSLLVFGQKIGNYLFNFFGAPHLFTKVWNYLRYEFSLLIIVIIFMVLYRAMPNKKIKFSEALPGTLIATSMWFLISSLFSIFIGRFFLFSSIYGGIGGIIIMLMWIFWCMHAVLIGATVNAILAEKE